MSDNSYIISHLQNIILNYGKISSDSGVPIGHEIITDISAINPNGLFVN